MYKRLSRLIAPARLAGVYILPLIEPSKEDWPARWGGSRASSMDKPSEAQS